MRLSRLSRQPQLASLALSLVVAGAGCGFRTTAEKPRARSGAAERPLQGRHLLLAVAQAGPRVVAVGERGRVVLSDDGGHGWRAVTTPVSTTLTGVHFVTARRGWAVGHETTILQTSDAGRSWRIAHHEANAERSVPLFALRFLDRRRGLAVGAYGTLLTTDDGGRSWRRQLLGVAEERHLYDLATTDDGGLWVAGEGGGLYRSADRGRSWQVVPLPVTSSLFGVVSLRSRGVLLFGLEGRVIHLDGAQGSPVLLRAPSRASLFAGVRREDGSAVLAGREGAVVLAHIDDGVRLTSLRGDRHRTWTGVLPLDDAALLLVGTGGSRRLVADEVRGARPRSRGASTE